MSPEETIAAARELDRLLQSAIEDLKMPEIGGKKLAGQFTALFADLRKQAEAVRTDIAAAGAEFMTEIEGGKKIAKQIREETAQVRTSFAEMLGNEPPTDGGTGGG